MKIEKYFFSGLLILLAGILILYGGYNRPGFKTLPDGAARHTNGAPAAAPLPHAAGGHK